MSIEIPNWYTSQFSANVQLKLQYMGSVLRSAVTEDGYVGDMASPVNHVGTLEMSDVVERFAPMPRKDAPLTRRWVSPIDSDLPVQVDKFDKLKTVVEPESPIVRAAVAAAGRRLDKHILSAFFAAAKTGVKGASSTAYDTANEVAVSVGGANSKANVEKFIEVKRLMRKRHVMFDQEEVYTIMTAEDEAALMREIQIVSNEFTGNDAPVLKSGKLVSFLGINFLYCELAETILAGTNKVTVPVWCKSGMHLGIWNDITTSLSQRNDLQGEPFQAYVYLSAGGARLEEEKVFSYVSYRA